MTSSLEKIKELEKKEGKKKKKNDNVDRGTNGAGWTGPVSKIYKNWLPARLPLFGTLMCFEWPDRSSHGRPSRG